MNGKVFLVGAGPGDPGLLTRRAAELIQSCDLIAIDALVSKEIGALVPREVEVIHVGKRSSAHTLPQDQINALLIQEAKKGRRVVRLKGGDPFVFGRGGEEAEDLVAAGVDFEIVPGISSSIAGPAYAGIPVTHRAYATSLTLVTGHESEGTTGINWPVLAKLNGTIVFMMGFANLPLIVHKLTEFGMSESKPVAVISKATMPEQRTVAGTLANIEGRVAEANLPTPALIVVGDVVRMREVINWFETKPLFGKRVVVTRAREQASELKRLFEESGAQVLQFPTIEIGAPASLDSLDRVVDALGDYQWIVFTSTNGVRSFFERISAKGRDARALAGCMIAAVGDTTAAGLRDRGIAADLVPERFQSAALLPYFEADQNGVRIAVIRAAEGNDAFLEEMRKRGATVDLAVAYETRAADYDLVELRERIANGEIDVVTFTSGSTVDHFYAKLTPEERARINQHAILASIGPVTSDAIRRYGKSPDVESGVASIEALHDAVVERVVGMRAENT
jgi:uroporphyrinogen III methyltransferase / synthase